VCVCVCVLQEDEDGFIDSEDDEDVGEYYDQEEEVSHTLCCIHHASGLSRHSICLDMQYDMIRCDVI
jgi:hypothetical protein